MKKSISPAIGKLISEGKINEAIELLKPRLMSLPGNAEYATQLHTLSDTYSRLLDFFMKGYPDPSRNEMIDSISKSLCELAETVDYETRVLENEGFYYAQIRSERLSHERLPQLLESYQSVENMLAHADGYSGNNQKMLEKRDDLLLRAFNKAMIVRSASSPGDVTFLQSVILSEEYSLSSRLQMLSALTLDLLACFDKGIFTSLLEIYEQSENDRIRAKALTGVFVALHLYSKFIETDKTLIARLTLLSDSILAYSHLRQIVLTMIRTRNTDQINQQFQREVLDNFKDARGKMPTPDSINISNEDAELNPEWQEFLEKSGIEKKLRKFSELQSEGADLMMITFSQLKNFSFFRNAANWFLPFDKSHSALSHYREMATDAIDTFMYLPGVMCDSDKYSLAFSMNQMPPEQRLMLSSQLEAQQEQMHAEFDLKNIKISNPEFSNEVLMTMRSLYRFTRLFNGASSCFNDPFEKPVDITAIPALQELMSEEEVLQLVSECYFKHSYYQEALKLFLILEKRGGLNMYLSEKIGYCYEKMLDYSTAYSYYCKAELLGAASKWLWKRMLTVLSDSDPALALQYAQRLYEADPSSLKSRLDYINALKNAGNDEELLRLLYQCYYESPENGTTTFLLTRTLIKNKNIDKAVSILETFNPSDAKTDDEQNEYNTLKGVVAIMQGEMGEGVAYLKKIGEHQIFTEINKLPDESIDDHTKKLIMELVRMK